MEKYSEYNEEDFLSLSGIQHFSFCPRQWGLIHIEKQWEENLLTVQGQLLHENIHNVFRDYKRKAKSYSCGISVHSRELGIYGVCDLLEFEDGKVFPVEYKRGRPKEHNADVLQLALQALCLEEMLSCTIETGFIYYGETRHRVQVEITPELRESVICEVRKMHELYESRYTPKAKKKKSCSACSLKNICLPQLDRVSSAQNYINNRLEEVIGEEAT